MTPGASRAAGLRVTLRNAVPCRAWPLPCPLTRSSRCNGDSRTGQVDVGLQEIRLSGRRARRGADADAVDQRI